MGSASRNNRESNRPIVIGILLPIAAVLLATLLLNRGADPDLPFARDALPGQGAEILPATGDPQPALPSSTAEQATEAQADDPATAAAARKFTVAIAPPIYDRNERHGAVAFPAFHEFHEFLIVELRSIRHIEIVELPGPRMDLTPADADFYVEIVGVASDSPPPAWTFQVFWWATREGSASWTKIHDSLESEIVAATAREAAAALRRYPFPPTDSRAAELEAIALDSERPDSERFEALLELHDVPKRFEFVGRDEQRMVSIAGAEIVRNSPDSGIRGRAWQAMEGAEDPYLIGPLVDSLLYDPSDFVRIEATKLLAREYSEDSRTQSTLQHALVNDLSPQVRSHARWESLDDDGRRAFLAATLDNPDLSDAERFLLVASDVKDVQDYFDRQSMLSLIDIAGRARASSADPVAAPDPGSVPAAQVVPLLLEYFRIRQNDQRIRASVATALIRHLDEPGVWETLDESVRGFYLPSSVRREVAAALRRPRSVGPVP